MHISNLVIFFVYLFMQNGVNCTYKCRLIRDNRLFLNQTARGSNFTFCMNRAKKAGKLSNGVSPNGVSPNGVSPNRVSPNGVSPNGVLFKLNLRRGNLNEEKIQALHYSTFRKKASAVYLWGRFKNGFDFFGFFKSSHDEVRWMSGTSTICKFCENITSNLSDITKVKQVIQLHSDKKILEPGIMKKILLHVVHSTINFKVINSCSYLIQHFKVSKDQICSLMNEISNEVKDRKQAENFLGLHIFFLKDENVSLFSMMHIIDFFRCKQKLMEVICSIKKKIYEQFVNDLIRRKVERYKLFCEQKKIQFHLRDALNKVDLYEKEDAYFSYDYGEVKNIFNKKLTTEKGREFQGTDMVEYLRESSNDRGGNNLQCDSDSGTSPSAEAEDNENLMELKKTYEEIQSFNESIIEHLEPNQHLFYFDENYSDLKINEADVKGKNHSEEGMGKHEHEQGQEEVGLKEGEMEEGEEEGEEGEEDIESIQKRVDKYIHEYIRDNNMTMEQFSNEFVEQADLNFKMFLKNVRLENKQNEIGGVAHGENSFEENSHGWISKGAVKSCLQNDEITNFKLRKLHEDNKEDVQFHLTNDVLYERLRKKMLYYLQKIEYLKFKYQYDIINEKYPINKNEKTVLDVLKYGYKIVVSPDVDNSVFHQNQHMYGTASSSTGFEMEDPPRHEEQSQGSTTQQMESTLWHGSRTWSRKVKLQIGVTNWRNYYDFKCRKCNYHIFNTSGAKEFPEKVISCPQCQTKC
ncbi:hypothetical protein, conserved [Plasmodium gonderi]|uniref:Zinc finger protein n=1 Tax=Plasmodium gonderi TaxID=77519 RepID=A0A1Y1JDX0_PLAGO|nr:hypothetical protein, conserved [Plasmodium gonderi]GAW80686.1 hypothetical protein, conserved [Plasmodium gonderi]